MVSKLTSAQRVTLEHIRRYPGVTWQEACNSGNKAPVYVRLHYLGCITEPPFHITNYGLACLPKT